MTREWRHEVSDGEYEWVTDLDWTMDARAIGDRLCRFQRCRQPAVAAFARHDRRSVSGRMWWAYCEAHVEGLRRRIVNGQVEQQVRVGSPAYMEAHP